MAHKHQQMAPAHIPRPTCCSTTIMRHTVACTPGVMGVSNGPGGRDRHLTCNHLGPFLLTRLLESELGPGSRVVTVASRAHYAGRLRFNQQGQPVASAFWWWVESVDERVVKGH